MIKKTKILGFLLFFGVAISASASYETLWSDSFSIDTALAQTVDLKSSDAVFASTAYYWGSADEVELTAEGATSGDAYQIAELVYGSGSTSNAWNYFVDNADLNENYLLTLTAKSGDGVFSTETVTVRLASALQDEGVFSGNFSLDTVGTAPNTTLTLLTTDDIVYDARWAEGSDRVIKVTAVSQEASPESYDLFESESEEHGTFRWDYLTEEVPSTVNYTLYYEIANEAGTETYATVSAQPTIHILPEPLAPFVIFALAAFLSARKKLEQTGGCR